MEYFWYSEKQKQIAGSNYVTIPIHDGEGGGCQEFEYTEMGENNMPFGKWDDYTFVACTKEGNYRIKIGPKPKKESTLESIERLKEETLTGIDDSVAREKNNLLVEASVIIDANPRFDFKARLDQVKLEIDLALEQGNKQAFLVLAKEYKYLQMEM